MNINIPSYNSNGKKSGTKEIKTNYKKLDISENAIYQLVNSYQSNARQVLSHTKTRSEVSGTGKKPYRQKGTGNARFGSLRTPIHAGGGIAFGPRKNRNFNKNIPTKLKRKSLLSLLSLKVKNNELFSIDLSSIKLPNTKFALKEISKYPFKAGSILICVTKKDENIYKSLRNVPNIDIIPVNTLNGLYVLSYDNIVFVKDAHKFFEYKANSK